MFTARRIKSGFDIIPVIDGQVEIKNAPHNIEDCFISEGFYLRCKIVRREKNSEIVQYEDIPHVFCRHFEQSDILDAQHRIEQLYVDEPKDIGGRKIYFKRFSPVPKQILPETITKITNYDYISFTELAEDIYDILAKNIDLGETALRTIVLWIMGTYIHDAFRSYPYLWINGIKQSGKTRLLEIIDNLAYHAIMGADFTAPALFRTVAENRCTICFDEAENLFKHQNEENEKIIRLLNSGYKVSGQVRLVEKDANGFSMRVFSAYSPKVLVSINPIAPTLQDRCIQIIMLKTTKPKFSDAEIDLQKCAELLQKLYLFRFSEGVLFHYLSEQHTKLRETYQEKYKLTEKKIELKNRDWELFKPILLLCDRVMPEWIESVAAFIDTQQILRTDDILGIDEMVIEALDKIGDESLRSLETKEWVYYYEIVEKVKEMYHANWVNQRTLSNSLRRLGFADKKRRMGKGMQIFLDLKLIEEHKERLEGKWYE